MEEYLKQQREKLQQKVMQGLDLYESEHWHQQIEDTDLPWHENWDESKPEEADLEFITYVLDSFTKPRSTPALHFPREFSKTSNSLYQEDLQEGVSLWGCAKHQVMLPKFNYKLIIKMLSPENVSCEPDWDPDTVNHQKQSDIGPDI
jgi:hypothetical protein